MSIGVSQNRVQSKNQSISGYKETCQVGVKIIYLIICISQKYYV